MLVITIDPETGEVVAVQDNRGVPLMSPVKDQVQSGTLSTSTAPKTINVELRPAGTSSGTSGGTTFAAPAGAVAGAPCRIVIINGVPKCI